MGHKAGSSSKLRLILDQFSTQKPNRQKRHQSVLHAQGEVYARRRAQVPEPLDQVLFLKLPVLTSLQKPAANTFML